MIDEGGRQCCCKLGNGKRIFNFDCFLIGDGGNVGMMEVSLMVLSVNLDLLCASILIGAESQLPLK